MAPDGLHIAVACKDGVLRVYALPSGGLVAGFKVRGALGGGLQLGLCWLSATQLLVLNVLC